MATKQSQIGEVGEIIDGLLPRLNEGFEWERIKTRYDAKPEGTAMSLHLTDETGDEEIEQILLAIDDGPRMVRLERLTPRWNYIGAVVTYQEYGLRILDVDDDMTPDKARYTHRGVKIEASEGESRERVWLVISNVLDTMLDTLIYQYQEENDVDLQDTR